MNPQMTKLLGEATFATDYGDIAVTAYRNDLYGGEAVCFSGVQVGSSRYAASYRACDGTWCVLDATDSEALRPLADADAMRIVEAAGLAKLIEANRPVLGLASHCMQTEKRTAA